jgi:chromosome segregation ATPase
MMSGGKDRSSNDVQDQADNAADAFQGHSKEEDSILLLLSLLVQKIELLKKKMSKITAEHTDSKEIFVSIAKECEHLEKNINKLQQQIVNADISRSEREVTLGAIKNELKALENTAASTEKKLVNSSSLSESIKEVYSTLLNVIKGIAGQAQEQTKNIEIMGSQPNKVMPDTSAPATKQEPKNDTARTYGR